MVALEPLASILGAARGRARAVMGVRGRTVAVQGRGRVVEAVQGRTVAVRGRDRAVEGVRGRMVAVQGQGRVRAERVRATAALLVPDPATMQEEEQESAAPERVGLEPGALDPVGRVGPGQAQALVPPAIPELSG